MSKLELEGEVRVRRKWLIGKCEKDMGFLPGTHRKEAPPVKGSPVLFFENTLSGFCSFQMTTGMILNKWKVNSVLVCGSENTDRTRVCKAMGQVLGKKNQAKM